MRNLKKPTVGMLMATLIFSNIQLSSIYGYEVDNIKENTRNQIVEKNYKNTNQNKSEYIKNYVSKSADANAVVNIPDANLKKEIYETLGKQDNETITKGELESIRDLYILNSEITNLEGIQYCINLKNLTLCNNQINDISALSELTNLEYLDLTSNKISDVRALTNLTNLRDLYLYNNKISNISALSRVTNLESLSLSNNQISDISALSDMSKLEGLYLSNNGISDISILSKLKNISGLELSNNKISNISALSNLVNLDYLYLDNNNISDISALSNLTKLDMLGLDNNNISDINPISTSLKHNEGFTFLTLSNNNISDISVLSNLPYTESLDLSNNQISDISPLSNARIIRTLDLSNNQISDISALKNLHEVYEMNLSNNQINDISIFSNSSIEEFYIGTFLDTLDLSNNNITDISSLSNLEWIQEIDLSNNKISDITSLLSMNNSDEEYNSYNLFIDLTINPIDLNNAKNMEAISRLEKLGYEVYCDGLDKSHKPVILAEDKIIMCGDTFEELSGIVAKDKNGVDITDKIEVIENDVWPTSLGVYDVIYKVTDSQGISTIKKIKVTVTKKIDGISLEKGNGTQSNPVVALLQDEKATDELFSNLDNKFEYSIVGTPIIENNYKIYKLKLNNKARIANEAKYIELKVDLKNTDIINKLDKILVNNNISITETKLIGDNRYKTAIKVSNRGWSKADNVVIVNSSAMVDALSATPFAKTKDAPILLTAANQLNNETKKEIERLGAKNAYIIGGTNSVSENIVSQLKSMNLNVDRISGDDRYTTSLEIAKRLGNVSEIAVVNGVKGLADAVSIAPVAAERNMPIVLSSPNQGTKTFDEFIKNNNVEKSYVIGGENSISKDVAAKLPNADRLGGLSRNETNAIILEKFYTNKDLNNIFVAKDGKKKVDDLIDALAVGVLSAKENSPLVIVGNELDAKQEELLKSKTPKEVTQVGGNGNENAFNQIVNMFKK